MAMSLVFLGRKFDAKSAVYAGPTPWQATFPVSLAFKPPHTAGPTEIPYAALKTVLKQLGESISHHQTGFSGSAGKDKCYVFAVSVSDIVGVGFSKR